MPNNNKFLVISPLSDIRVTIYFRIHGAELFGGPDSVGYSSQSFDHCDGVPAADESFIKMCRVDTAKMMQVPEEAVAVIPWSVYEKETEDEDEGDWDDI